MTDPELSAESTVTEVTRASVFVAGRESAYVRAGTGVPVLVLIGDDSAREPVTRALATVARVIIPQRIPDDPTTPIVVWILGFLDGLGLDRAAIVVDAPNTAAALAATLADPDRISHLAVLAGAATPSSGGGIEDRLSTGQRLLVGNAEWPGRLEGFFVPGRASG